ncbi:MAG: hypothetical protein MJK18_02140, partial [Bdellovibrionales bacterium]|nr:hypothetical protein [Bdellovibrionales bacterium]
NTAARNNVGGFVGSVRNGGANISNSSTNFDPNGTSYVGGFVGFIQGNSSDPTNRVTMDTDTAEGDVTCSGTQCGGFVGRALRMGTISTSTVNNAAGSLSATGASQNHMGGFVGYLADDFRITNSTTNLDLDTLGEFVGGFAGFLEGHADITDSSATADTIVGEDVMGGFIGKVECTTTSVNADGRCDLLRNYATITSITHHTPATTSSYWSAGFAADVRTSNNDSEIYIEDSFSVVGTINSNFHSGGFIGIMLLEGDSGVSGDKIYVRRNYVGPGTLQAGAAINAVDFGGFIGILSGSSSLNQGEVYVEDNYTALTTIDTSNFNAGSFFVGLGGFIGTDESYVGASFLRNYTSVQTISGNESARHISGFIGNVDQPGAGFTNSVYQNNFTTTNTIQDSPFEASFFYGILDGTVSPTESGNYYRSGMTCLEADELTACSARLTESATTLANFQDDNTNAPLTSWDFVNVWQSR